MATTTTMILCFMFMVTVLLGNCSATVYKVGDSDGWTTKRDTYNDWTKGKEFHVGDSLVFEYNRTLENDVTLVSGALQYQLCDSFSPKAVYKTGHDTITLRAPGYYYFITSNYFQCASGQKLEILVVQNPSSSPIIPSPPPPSRNNRIYRVGDARGWSVYGTEYYYNWGKAKEFYVGDSLLFVYRKESNDVYEVSGDVEFITCDTTSPLEVYKTGHDLVRLTKPGVHYFISSNTGHCQDGLKLQVVVRPRPEAVDVNPDVPRPRIGLSPLDRFRNRWPRIFGPRPRIHH